MDTTNNKNYYILGAVALVIVAGAIYLFNSKAPVEETNAPLVGNETPVIKNIAPITNTPNETISEGTISIITYTDKGFLPNAIEVAVGTKVVFTNKSNNLMWVASAMHPTHQALPGFDQLTSGANGTSYEYTFTKVGAWKFHDHLNPAMRGSVTVK